MLMGIDEIAALIQLKQYDESNDMVGLIILIHDDLDEVDEVDDYLEIQKASHDIVEHLDNDMIDETDVNTLQLLVTIIVDDEVDEHLKLDVVEVVIYDEMVENDVKIV